MRHSDKRHYDLGDLPRSGQCAKSSKRHADGDFHRGCHQIQFRNNHRYPSSDCGGGDSFFHGDTDFDIFGLYGNVQNDAQNKGVMWTLSGAGCSGATCGTLTNVSANSATYNAPASVPSPASVTLMATSVTDGTKSAFLTITILATPPPPPISFPLVRRPLPFRLLSRLISPRRCRMTRRIKA